MWPSVPTDDLHAVILAGGRSTRMGTDKRFLDYHGIAQVEYLFNMLTATGLQVYTSCRESDPVAPTLNPVVDSGEFSGPLAGIIAVLNKHPSKGLLAVAVDMPYVNQQAIMELISHRDTQRFATCFLNQETGRPEPLLSIWEPACLGPLMDQIHAGNFSPVDFLITHPVNLLNPTNHEWLRNINSPEDLDSFNRQSQSP
ncbi:MAG: molybdenum cofactor guanylyltransferase [Bacteroidota bacterium]